MRGRLRWISPLLPGSRAIEVLAWTMVAGRKGRTCLCSKAREAEDYETLESIKGQCHLEIRSDNRPFLPLLIQREDRQLV